MTRTTTCGRWVVFNVGSDITFDIIARDRASSKFDRVGKSADRGSRSLRMLGKAGKYAAFGLAGAVGAAAVAAGKLAKGAAEDQASAALMAKQFRNSAKATRVQVAATEEWITKMGVARGVADDQLRPALSNLVRSTHDVGKAQKLTSLAMDIAAATGRDLGAVSIALAKANQGSVVGLTRMGIAVKDAEGKTKSFKELQKDLAKQFGGSSAAKAETLSGQIDRLKVRFTEAGEAIGYKLIPWLTKGADWMTNKGIPAAQKYGAIFKEKVTPPLRALAEFIGTKIIPWFKKFGDESSEQSTLLKKFGSSVRSTFNDIKSILASAQSIFQSFWSKYGDMITKYGVNTLLNAVTVIRGAFAVIAGLFKTVAAVLKGDWSGAWDGMKQTLRGAVSVIKGLVGQMWNQVRSLFSSGVRTIGTLATKAWRGIKNTFSAGVNSVVSLVKSLPGQIAKAAKRLGGILAAPFLKVISTINSALAKIAELKAAMGDGPGKHVYTPKDQSSGGLGIPKMARGGIVRARRGGTLALLGEAGRDEAVVPLSRGGRSMGAGGGTVNIIFNGLVTDPLAVAREVEKVLAQLKNSRSNRPLAFS